MQRAETSQTAAHTHTKKWLPSAFAELAKGEYSFGNTQLSQVSDAQLQYVELSCETSRRTVKAQIKIAKWFRGRIPHQCFRVCFYLDSVCAGS